MAPTHGESRLVMSQRVPVGGRGIVPDYGLGESPLSSPSFSSLARSASSGASKARINVIGPGSDVVGIAHPLMKAALKSAKVSRFSGKSEEYEEWENSWNQYLRLVHGGGETVLPDQTVLMTLKGYLDDASAADLQAKMNVDDNLS